MQKLAQSKRLISKAYTNFLELIKSAVSNQCKIDFHKPKVKKDLNLLFSGTIYKSLSTF